MFCCVAVYNEKLLSLLEEEELIWLFSSISLLLLFLRKPDELEAKPCALPANLFERK